MGFYKSAFVGFTVQLLILLAIMAYILSNMNKNQQFPASISNCPDFYSLNNEGNCMIETSVYSSQDNQCKILNPRDMSLRDQKIWAVDCGVSWDGITNNSSI